MVNALAVVKEAGGRPPTSPGPGAATRISKHRLLMGAISLEVLFAQRIMRIFDMYFSMVRRSAAWASRESESASLMTTTKGGDHPSASNAQTQVRKTGGANGRTFEPLFGVQVHLLRLRDLLQQILNDDPIVVPDITWGQFDMKVALNDVHV